MNRVLVAVAAGAILASAPALACDDMKSGSYDGGVIASQAPAPVVTPQKVEPAAEPPLVVKQKQSPAKKSTTTAKPLPQGGVMVRTGG